MKAVVASTEGAGIVESGLSLLASGGNAVDAAVAAVLAWPPALNSAGMMVAVGTGLGHSVALFPVHAPGHGLSRPRRLQLLKGESSSASVAIPCTAQALTAILSRWGTTSIARVSQAVAQVLSAHGAPHLLALELLEREGVGAFTKGTFAVEAARALGPLEGGLLTRKDLIEARPALGQALGPHYGLWLPESIENLRTLSGHTPSSTGHRILSVVIIDRRGLMVSASLDAGPTPAEPLPEVAGITPNTLLSTVTPAQAKKVGQPLPFGCCAVAGGDAEQIALAGPLAEVLSLSEDLRPEVQEEREEWEPQAESGTLVVRRSPGGKLESWGAATVRSS